MEWSYLGGQVDELRSGTVFVGHLILPHDDPLHPRSGAWYSVLLCVALRLKAV